MENLELLIDNYCHLKVQIEPLQETLKILNEQIKNRVLEDGQSITTNRAKVTIRRAYVRSSWDSKKLKGFAVAYPEILEFCTEKEISETISIKIL